jgi:hypothetical protein
MSWIADRDEEVRTLVLRLAQDLAQEAHRARRVGQRGAARGVESRQEHAHRDAHRLLHVVVLVRTLRAVGESLGFVVDDEDDDQIRCDLQERLSPVGT